MAAAYDDMGAGAVEKPLVSVLMPAYNSEKTILAAMGSVLRETDVPLELIVVEDASTDRTGEVIDAMAAADPRVRAIHRAENGGEGPARNSGLELVRGEWLVLLDSDDLLVEGALAKLAGHMRATKADVLITRYRYQARESGEDLPVRHSDLLSVEGPFDPAEKADGLLAAVKSGIANKVFRMERIRELGLRFQDIPRIADLRFTLGACALARLVEYADVELYIYRVGGADALIASGHRYPLALAQAVCALKDLLEEHGVWSIWRKGFLDWFVRQVPYNLKLMNPSQAVDALEEELRERTFAYVGLDSLSREECGDKTSYDLCMLIWHGVSGLDAERCPSEPRVSVIVPVYNVGSYLRLGACRPPATSASMPPAGHGSPSWTPTIASIRTSFPPCSRSLSRRTRRW